MTNDPIAFKADLRTRLPETYASLAAANLRLHPRVTKVTLHGSRGLKGGFRPGSDIDLSLLTDIAGITGREELDHVLRAVLRTSLAQWQGMIEPDLAAFFDLKACGLACFGREAYEGMCPGGGVECFGMYKVQKGFSGLVPSIGVRAATELKAKPVLPGIRRTRHVGSSLN